jgi:hypothetical protein
MKAPKRKRKSRKGEKHEKPLSLYGMSFDEAVTRLVAANSAEISRADQRSFCASQLFFLAGLGEPLSQKDRGWTAWIPALLAIFRNPSCNSARRFDVEFRGEL